jgi:hypothetical protein
MPAALLADFILALHAAIVLFVVGGLALIVLGGLRGWALVRKPWLRLAHLATVAYVVLNTWLGELCPLTIWEQHLRRAAGEAVHDSSFIAYWLDRLLYVEAPWWAFVAVYTVFGLLVLLSWLLWPPAWPRRAENRITATGRDLP